MTKAGRAVSLGWPSKRKIIAGKLAGGHIGYFY